MKLVIFGANGPVGLLLTDIALGNGHDVTAVTRRPDAFPREHERLSVVRGDVFNYDDVLCALEGNDAVLSLFGVPYSLKPISVYSEGTTNIIRAMNEAGIKRLVCCTSGGTNPNRDLSEGVIFSMIIKPIFGRTMYRDMRLMEELVMQSELDWTIARPAELVDGDQVSAYRVAESYMVPGLRKTSRIDLADFMLKEAETPVFLCKAIAVGTR